MEKNIFIILFILCHFSISAFAKMNLKDIHDAYIQSYRYEKTQNYIDAIKAIKIVSINYPKAYTVNLRLGFLYLLNENYANASKHYEVAQKALPFAISPLIGQMSIGIATKKYEEVETLGFKIIKNDLYNYYGNLKLAYSLIMQSKYEAAQKIIFKMLSLYPEDTAFLAQSARIYSLTSNLTAATEVYNNVLVLDPENVEANYFISIMNKKVQLKETIKKNNKE